MSSTGFSRRQFILSSVATGIAGVISRPALSAVAASPSTDSQNQLLTFEVIGDRDRGYGVDILFKRDRVARHNAGGEFSAVFQNTDRSREDRIESWKASSWKGDHRHLYLQGEFQLPNLNTTVGVQVEYEAVNGNVARKRIRFHQADSYVLLYQLTNSLESLDAPARFWSFDQLDCGGGALHEYFPAAGFRTPSGVAVGLLTDAGYRNNWSRIIRRDVEAVQAAPRPAAAPAAAPQPAGSPRPTAVPARPQFVIPPRPEAEFEDVGMSPMRAAIAKRMPMSKAPVPHFYVTSEVAMDEVWALRERLNALEGQPKISVTDMVIKAVALALLKNPGVNAQLNGQAIRVYHRAHIGIAVALDQGLITPVLRDCDAKPLARIAVESRDLAERARGGKLRAQEMSGATFSISNLGMFDVEEFSAIINPPEGAILAVGSVLQKPVVEDGELRVGRRMKMTISCDHRVMDGAMGARFLQDVKRLLEEPLRLLV